MKQHNLKRRFYAFSVVAVFCLSVLSLTNPSHALPTPYLRNNSFHVPPDLRPRVNFWKDVFGRYGRHEQVIHHRLYPQIVFGSIDFREDAAKLDPIPLEKLKKRVAEERLDEIRDSLKRLAKGEKPDSKMDVLVQQVMAPLAGGTAKYQKALDEDLIRTQTGIRERFGQAIARSGRYLHFMEKIFMRDYGLPVELTRLPFVESSFDYTAYSSAGAAGIWQFMPRTARVFNLTVSSTVDERRDPIEATKAAAMYLKDAYAQLGSWPLALTSYNHGVYGVKKKVREYGTTDIVRLIEHPTDPAFGFASSNFYPEFLAALEIFASHAEYFPEIEIEQPLNFVEFTLPRATSAQYLSRQLNVSVENLKLANYAVSEAVWKGRYKIPAGYTLKVPKEGAAQMARLGIPEPSNQPIAPPASAVYGGTTYKVRRGDTLLSISKKYGTSVAALKTMNGLDSHGIREGQMLTVKERTTPAPKVVSTAPKAEVKKVISAKTSSSTYRVVKGDTLSSISKKFSITIEQLKKYNGLKSNKLSLNQMLKIPGR